MARIVKFIHVETHRGAGSKTDPYRMIQQLWTAEGDLVAEYDPFDATRSFYRPRWHRGSIKSEDPLWPA